MKIILVLALRLRSDYLGFDDENADDGGGGD